MVNENMLNKSARNTQKSKHIYNYIIGIDIAFYNIKKLVMA